MRKSSLTLSGVGFLLLSAFLLLGCGGGGNVLTTATPSVGGSLTSDHPQGAGNFEGLVYGPEGPAPPSFSKQFSIASNSSGNETIVTIKASDVKDLTGFAYELRYDPAYHNPVRAEFTDFIGTEEEVVNFVHLETPAVVSLASVMVDYDEAEGVSGSGEIVRVYFENAPFTAKRNISQFADLGPVEDFAQPDAAGQPKRFTWTSSFFRGDGNRSGKVDISDVFPLADNFFKKPGTVPGDLAASVADYNNSGTVDISDVFPLADRFFVDVLEFFVEVSTQDPSGTPNWAEDGVIDYDEDGTDAPTGFFAYDYTLQGDYTGFNVVWARLNYRDVDGNLGTPTDPVAVNLAGPPPTFNIALNGIMVQIENTVTDEDPPPGGDASFYHTDTAAAAGSGEVQANGTINVRLVGFHYTWLPPDGDGQNYGMDIPGLTAVVAEFPQGHQTDYETIREQFRTLLPTSVTVTPTGDEWFTPGAPPDTYTYTGVVGPNSMDPYSTLPPSTLTVSISFDPDNKYTGGLQRIFGLNVTLRLTEDPNAPEIWSLSQTEQELTAMPIVALGVDFGQDDWPPDKGPDDEKGTAPAGQEYTAVPVLIQLVDLDATGGPIYLDPRTDDQVIGWTPDPNGAETPDDPSEVGFFTFTRVPSDRANPGEPFHPQQDPMNPFLPTMNIKVWMHAPQALPPGSSNKWHFRIIDSLGNVRSSAYNPFNPDVPEVITYSFVQPRPLTVATWPPSGDPTDPMAPGIYPGVNGPQFIYFLPGNPTVRVNPEGAWAPGPQGPVWTPDEQQWYDTIRKVGDPDPGEAEFVLQLGDPMDPDPWKRYDAPYAVYSIGDVAINTPEQADGVLGSPRYHQPFCLGFDMTAIGNDPQFTADGPVTLALFALDKTKLAQVVRKFVVNNPGRDRPYVNWHATDANLRDDVGINIWGADGTLPNPDWSDHSADKSERDLVFLEVHNLWYRHKSADDGQPAQFRASVIELRRIPGGQVPNIQVLPRLIDPGYITQQTAKPAIVAFDVGHPRYWNNVGPDPIPNGVYEIYWYDPFTGEYSEPYLDPADPSGNTNLRISILD